LVVPRRRQVRRAKKEEVIDPQVMEMFDKIWEALLEIAEEETVYPISAPLTTEKVLKEVKELLRQDLEDSLDEELFEELCDACYCVPQHFVDYVLTGGEELPSRKDLEDCISERIEMCGEISESLDEFVYCVNERYNCFLLLNKFFSTLPHLLEVKVVEGEVTPDLCSSDVTSEEIAWYVGLKVPGAYGERPIHLEYYGVRDGRVMVTGLGLGGWWCDEDFAEKEVPRLVDRLKELSIRPDLVVHVYGEPPFDIKSISPTVLTRRLEALPEP
jgi:hypothetical protein